MTLKHRWSLIASFVCSALVAVLWSLNLGAVYPFVEVVLKNQSLHEWVVEEQKAADKIIDERNSKILELEKQLAAAEGDAAQAAPQAKPIPLTENEIAKLKNQISANRFEIDVQEAQAKARAKIAPYIAKYAPKDPFNTLALLMGLMFFGTVLRGLFLMGSMVAVALSLIHI